MTPRITRRATVIGLLLLAAPLTAGAQPAGQVARIGYLGATSPSESPGRVEAFRRGLRDQGYVEGQNLVIEYRWADGRGERLPELASELVRLNVRVIFAPTTPAALAAKKATTTIPVVFALVADPVRSGLVTSLARPGGTITGMSLLTPDVNDKRLELLKETVPGLRRVVVLRNPDSATADQQVTDLMRAGATLGVKIHPVDVHRQEDLDGAFLEMKRSGADGVFVLVSPFNHRQLGRIAELARQHRVPAIMEFREFVEAGGLIAYGPSLTDTYWRAGGQVARILKGTMPVDLPVEQPTKFDLVINLKTAKAFGVTIPPSVLLRAAEVME
ncbi:MAG: ABC transporter substrate-binding protein [Candidatus Rokuibacteriota bacterium]